MSKETTQELERFRLEIDKTDSEIIERLGRRFDICRRIAQLKKNQSIPMMQHGRVKAVKQRCRRLAIVNGLKPKLVDQIYTLIIAQSCEDETEIIERKDD